MSRIKILLLVLIIAVLSIIFIQNQQPITLKLLCADRSQTCLYRTPSLPLAVWMALAVLTGAISNLLIQTLERTGYRDMRRKPTILDEDLYSNGSSQSKSSRSQGYSKTTDFQNSTEEKVKSYEVEQEPQNVEKSGSTYSYKYREAGSKGDRSNSNKNSVDPEADINSNSESEGEDWI